jgi:hypothetical protein
MVQVAGHYVLKQDTKASAGRTECEPTAQGAGADDGDCLRQSGITWR